MEQILYDFIKDLFTLNDMPIHFVKLPCQDWDWMDLGLRSKILGLIFPLTILTVGFIPSLHLSFIITQTFFNAIIQSFCFRIRKSMLSLVHCCLRRFMANPLRLYFKSCRFRKKHGNR